MQALFELSFPELLHRAQTVHIEHFDPTLIEFATLLSIKTGGCHEDCGYCPQSAKHPTGVEAIQADGACCKPRNAPKRLEPLAFAWGPPGGH